MLGHEEIIERVNAVLTAELPPINQYFVDAKMLAHWGYERLAAHFREAAIGHMTDADELIERVLVLDGARNLQRLGTVRVGETVVEKLQLALDLEREAIARLNEAIATSIELGDHGTRQVFDDILE